VGGVVIEWYQSEVAALDLKIDVIEMYACVILYVFSMHASWLFLVLVTIAFDVVIETIDMLISIYIHMLC